GQLGGHFVAPEPAERMPRHAADDDRRGDPRIICVNDEPTRSVQCNARPRPQGDLATSLPNERGRRPRKQIVERYGRESDRRSRRIRSEQFAEHPHEGRRRRRRRRLIQRRNRERMPQPATERRRLASISKPLRHRESRGRLRGHGLRAARAHGPEEGKEPKCRQSIGRIDPAPAHETADEMPGRGQWRTGKRLDTALAGHRDGKLRLERRQIRGANTLQEVVGLAIAAKERVLPVVHALAGIAIDKRSRAPAGAWRFLENHDSLSALRQTDRGTEAGESAAHNHRIRGWRQRWNRHFWFHQTPAARMAWRGRGTRMTPEKTSNFAVSIRRSRSK